MRITWVPILAATALAAPAVNRSPEEDLESRDLAGFLKSLIGNQLGVVATAVNNVVGAVATVVGQEIPAVSIAVSQILDVSSVTKTAA